MQTTERQVILHNTEGNHNKYYEITILYDKDKVWDGEKGVYTVRARWGRIEHFKSGSPQTQNKGDYTLLENAQANLIDLVHSKLKKGYEKVKDTQTKAHSVVSVAKAHMPYKDFDRTEHVETIAVNWWASFDNIEERSI